MIQWIRERSSSNEREQQKMISLRESEAEQERNTERKSNGGERQRHEKSHEGKNEVEKDWLSLKKSNISLEAPFN